MWVYVGDSTYYVLVRRMVANVRFFDGSLWEYGGRVHLVCMNTGWRVVGRGYMCEVDSREEGERVIAELIAEGQTHGVMIQWDC